MQFDPNPTSYLSPGDIRLAALSILNRSLSSLSRSDEQGSGAIRREPPPLLRLRTEEEEAAEIRSLVNRIREDRPSARGRLATTNGLVQKILDASNIEDANHVLREVREFAAGVVGKHSTAGSSGIFETTEIQRQLKLRYTHPFVPSPDLMQALERDLSEQTFVASAMQMCTDYRRSDRSEFSPDDDLALERAYRLLDQGVRMPRNYQSIRTDRHRPYQTYLSFADPGDGHLTVTVREADLLEGLIVHIEYIDRDNVDDKTLVEAYRLPSVRNAARVRLHVGGATPCTAFIGRPVFEGGIFTLGLLKAGHTMASVCSAMFGNGIADCKVAMDGLTAQQAVEFMRVVAGNVIRDPLKQRLSAAFNINSPLTDDLFSRGVPRQVVEPQEIALLATRLAALGGFQKIAWDGASDERPSKPIIGRLTRVQLLQAVHESHRRGLETYISAGMEPEHMRDAAYIGIGGVGIGTKLHHVTDGVIGEIDPELVRNALRIRAESSAAICGRAARQLAQLDWRYAADTLPPQLINLRHELFTCLAERLDVIDKEGHKSTVASQKLEARLQEILEVINSVPALPEDEATGDDLAGGRARRSHMLTGVSENGAPSSRAFEDPAETWAYEFLEGNPPGETATDSGRKRLAAQISSLLQAGDIDGLRHLYPL